MVVVAGIATLVTFSLKPDTSTASSTPTSPVKIRRPNAALMAGAAAGAVGTPTFNAVTVQLPPRTPAHC